MITPPHTCPFKQQATHAVSFSSLHWCNLRGGDEGFFFYVMMLHLHSQSSSIRCRTELYKWRDCGRLYQQKRPRSEFIANSVAASTHLVVPHNQHISKSWFLNESIYFIRQLSLPLEAGRQTDADVCMSPYSSCLPWSMGYIHVRVWSYPFLWWNRWWWYNNAIVIIIIRVETLVDCKALICSHTAYYTYYCTGNPLRLPLLDGTRYEQILSRMSLLVLVLCILSDFAKNFIADKAVAGGKVCGPKSLKRRELLKISWDVASLK